MFFTMARDINNPSTPRKRPPHTHTKRMTRKHPLGGIFHTTRMAKKRLPWAQKTKEKKSLEGKKETGQRIPTKVKTLW